MSASSPAGAEQSGASPHVIVRGNAQSFLQNITAGSHQFRADEPVSAGGGASAPDPYDYLMAALGACTSMTVGLYARRRKWPLQDINVALRHSRIHAKDCDDCLTKDGMLHQIEVQIQLTGALTAEQRATLMEVADKCPVHKTLTSEIKIRLAEAKTPIS